MGKFFTFLFGFLTALLILAGIAFWFLSKTDSRRELKPVALEAPVGKGVGKDPSLKSPDRSGLPKVEFSGIIDVAPHVAARLAKAKNWHIRIQANPWVRGQGGDSVGRGKYENPKFPMRYVAEWDNRSVEENLKTEDFGNFIVTVTLCVDLVGEENCGMGTIPRIQGHMRMPVKAPGGLAKGNVAFSPPPIILNRFIEKTNAMECLKADHSVQGKLVPTDAFLASKGKGVKVSLLAVPQAMKKFLPPFVGKDARTPTKQEAELLPSFGVAFQSLTLNGTDGAPFNLKIPDGFYDSQYVYFASVCKAGESDVECAAKIFPHPWELGLSAPERGWYKLVPKGFQSPTCGSKGAVLYLNEWKNPGGTATLENYRSANPPEIVEGMVF